MKELKTTILINAPITRVWQILTDQEAYSEWNPFIKKMEGKLAIGEIIAVEIQPPGQKPMTFKPQIKVYTPQQEFRWLGHLFVPGIFDGEHYFKLEATGNRQTKLIHGERFSGLFAGVILKMMGTNTKAGFEVMNEALKLRAEEK